VLVLIEDTAWGGQLGVVVRRLLHEDVSRVVATWRSVHLDFVGVCASLDCFSRPHPVLERIKLEVEVGHQQLYLVMVYREGGQISVLHHVRVLGFDSPVGLEVEALTASHDIGV
jgi:hypothetical protein